MALVSAKNLNYFHVMKTACSIVLALLLSASSSFAGTAYGTGRDTRGTIFACDNAYEAALKEAKRIRCVPGRVFEFGKAETYDFSVDEKYFYCKVFIEYACVIAPK